MVRIALNEAAVPKNTKMATKFCLAVFNGKWFVHVTLCMQKSIAQQDFHFLLCAFVAVLLEINQILDRLIIQLVWYILIKNIFTAVLVKVVDIYLAAMWLGKYPPLFTSTSGNKC